MAAAVVMAALVGLISPAAAFTDVGLNHPFRTEIRWASNNGIVNGYPDNTFRGNGQVTRQAASAFTYRFAAAPGFIPGPPSFSDVPPDHVFFLEIEWMAAAGITEGYSNGTFKPGWPVTRQAMAAYICRLFDCYDGAPSPNALPQFFFDVSRSHPFFIEITFAYLTEITDGYPYGFGYIFKPSGIVTRQAATAFIYRIHRLLEGAQPGGGSGATGASGAGELEVPGYPDWTLNPLGELSAG